MYVERGAAHRRADDAVELVVVVPPPGAWIENCAIRRFPSFSGPLLGARAWIERLITAGCIVSFPVKLTVP
jgi:hypothetical protein